MNTINKFTDFEKMLQEKLANHEYSYNNDDWLSFEKKLPKGKDTFHLPKNFVSYLILTVAVVISAFLVLYFTNIFDANYFQNTTKTNSTLVKNNNDDLSQNTTDDFTNSPKTNQRAIAESDNSTIDDGSTATSKESNDKSSVETNNTKENSNQNAIIKENSSTNNINNSQNNNSNYLNGELISSDVSEGCAPLRVKFTPLVSSESITYLWAFGDGKTSSKASPSHVYVKSGTYTVTLSVKLADNKTTKKTEYSQKINVKSAAVADFGYTADSETDEYSFTDNSKDAFVWTWNFGDKTTSVEKDPKHTYILDGIYNVQLIAMNTQGCSDTLSKKIAVKIKDVYYCPTGFSPNGDGLNDYFGPIGERMNPDGYQMYIFDKNGILVFETTDLSVLWDGKKYQSNSEAEQGLYFWKISMKDKNNVLKDATGYLTLMK